jgi:hypothetical protein
VDLRVLEGYVGPVPSADYLVLMLDCDKNYVLRHLGLTKTSGAACTTKVKYGWSRVDTAAAIAVLNPNPTNFDVGAGDEVETEGKAYDWLLSGDVIGTSRGHACVLKLKAAAGDIPLISVRRGTILFCHERVCERIGSTQCGDDELLRMIADCQSLERSGRNLGDGADIVARFTSD